MVLPRSETISKPSALEKLWCGREDSNFHEIAPTATSTLRVYQFRHDRTHENGASPMRSFGVAEAASPDQAKDHATRGH